MAVTIPIFVPMKKYQLPEPLWISRPQLEQQDPAWNHLLGRTPVRTLKRFFLTLTPHDKHFYARLFPLPFDWNDLMPCEWGEIMPKEFFVEEKLLKLRRWTPVDTPIPEVTRPEDCLVIPADIEHIFLSPGTYERFEVRMHREERDNCCFYSFWHCFITAYALFLGKERLYGDLLQSFPGDTLQERTLKKARQCQDKAWLDILPHLLGVSLYRLFTQHHHLRTGLQKTGDCPIVFLDPEDKVLGGEFVDGIFQGENLYGKALMQVRSEINRIYDNHILCQGLKEEEKKEEKPDPFDFPF